MSGEKLSCILLIGLVFIMSISAVAAADNTTDSDDKFFDDIQVRINDAKENDTIEIDGYYSGQGREITVDKALTIQGKNATLDGKNTSRAFYINAGTTFMDMTFTNGNASKGGAIFSNTTSRLTFINCTFTNNNAKYGGAIMAHGMCDFINCTFKDNHAEASSAIGFNGDWNDAKINIENSSFEDNENNMMSCFDTVNAKNSRFINNGESAINAFFADVYDCIFTNNKRAIFCEESGRIIRCNFTNNSYGISSSFAGFKVKDSHFEMNTNAIVVHGSSSIDSSTFINNTCAIYSAPHGIDAYISGLYASDIKIRNSTFQSNHGAIYNYYNNMKIINTTFMDNERYEVTETFTDPSVIDNCGGKVTLESCTLKNNAPASIRISYAIDETKYASYWRDGVLKVNNVKYTNAELNDALKPVNIIGIKTSKRSIEYGSGDKLTIRLKSSDALNETVILFIKPNNGDYEWIIKGDDSVGIYTIYDCTGTVRFPASSLPAGTYELEIATQTHTLAKSKITLKVSKAKTVIRAPEVTGKKYFKVSVKHKTTKKPVKNVIIKLKIGKTTYKIKTNKKGIATFNTKNLSKGKHNVKITSGNANYKMNAKSSITVK